MKIKQKLTLGVGLLFAMILVMIVLSTAFINMLSSDSKNILTANYNTLDYSRNMLLALDNYGVEPSALQKFSINLAKQIRTSLK